MDTKALTDCWVMFQREHNVSIDRLVCDPALRSEFVASATRVCGSNDEREILWTLMRLRKNKSLSPTE